MRSRNLTGVDVGSLPVELARLHRQTEPGDRARITLPAMVPDRGDLLMGGGFVPVAPGTVERFRTLPDTVGRGMEILVCGLNPSPASADDGIGFARPGNRFWPAALAAGLASVDRDPLHALDNHAMGMTDLVKRTTSKASELTAAEFRTGAERLERLTSWLQPKAVLFVGFAGWRAARDKRAKSGWQERTLGGRPVYLMGSTSGLNANSQLPDFIAAMRDVRSAVS